ncbi:MAG: carbohydrate ABC transporter permease [Clostridiales bacterium]|jgi:putative aldouronate transport system permease protein|nr:carbohydrate ABC transporter permease [Clostridiales bacterium]
MIVEPRKKVSYLIGKISIYIILVAVALVCVLPFWHVLMQSLSDPIKLYSNKNFLWWFIKTDEGKASSEAYQMIFAYKRIWRAYGNTVLYTFTSTILGLILMSTAAYVLSRRRVMLNKFLMVFIMITMFFSGGLIPYFIVVRSLGLANTPLALIIPGCINAFYIIMLKNGMESLPYDYYEAARVDGAGHLYCYARVIMPLVGPFLSVTVLFSAIGHWNSWVAASIFINSRHPELYPLQIVLRDILVRNDVPGIVKPGGYPLAFYMDAIKSASIIVGSLPLLLVYPFVQKYFEKGIVLGGVKG